MRNGCFCVITALLALCLTAAAPKATVTAFSQDPASGEVAVSYTVDGDSIVTAEFLAGDEALACEEYADRLTGTINREVAAGKTYTFKWSPGSFGNGIDLSGKTLEVRLTAWDRLSPPPYMALDLTVASNVAYYASSNAVPGGVHDFRYKGDFMLMRRIPAKNVVWRMGMRSDSKAYDTWSAAGYHKVKLSHDYYIGVFAVTQRQHERLTGLRYWNFFSSDKIVNGAIAYRGRPVMGVSYDEIRGVNDGSKWPDEDFETAHAVDEGSFVHKARALTGKLLDLPTEAQWEFACRSGCAADVYTGKWITSQAERTYTYDHGFVARCHQNSNYDTQGFDAKTVLPDDGGTATVGSYLPNGFGLYDMLGNVREWCLDWYSPGEQDADALKADYAGAQSSSQVPPRRVLKGGAYSDGAYICSCGGRSHAKTDEKGWPTGYRLCLVIR